MPGRSLRSRRSRRASTRKTFLPSSLSAVEILRTSKSESFAGDAGRAPALPDWPTRTSRMSRSSTLRITRQASSGAISNSSLPCSTGEPSSWLRSPETTRPVEWRDDLCSQTASLRPARVAPLPACTCASATLALARSCSGEGVAIAAFVLPALGQPALTLYPQITVVEGGEELAPSATIKPARTGASRRKPSNGATAARCTSPSTTALALTR
jgi:hypothetical protein